MNDSPECFGKYTDSNATCGNCLFCESCLFFVSAEKETDKIEKSIYRRREFNDNIKSHNETQKNDIPIEIDSQKLYTHDEVVALSAYLLRVGRDRRLGPILSAKLQGSVSFAAIARKEGVTRQAIHKRVGKQLAKIFGYKNRQLTDSRLLTLDKEEFHLLKLIRAGADDEDLIEILKCTKKELKEKKEKLDKKITRWT